MRKLESSFLNMTAVLVAVTVVMGGLLAFVNHITTAPIKEQKEKALTEGIATVMGDTKGKVVASDTLTRTIDGKPSVFIIHRIIDNNSSPVGAAVESTVMGFGGDLKVLVGFGTNNKILGYTVLQSSETPGLGAKADKWFQKDGSGCIIGRSLSGNELLKVKKDGGDVDAITASTITSRAFLNAINNAYIAYSGNKRIDGESGPSIQNKDKGDKKEKGGRR